MIKTLVMVNRFLTVLSSSGQSNSLWQFHQVLKRRQYLFSHLQRVHCEDKISDFCISQAIHFQKPKKYSIDEMNLINMYRTLSVPNNNRIYSSKCTQNILEDRLHFRPQNKS